MVAPRRHRLDSLYRFACMLALVQLGVAGTVFAQQKPLSDGHLPGRNPFDDKFGAFVKDTLNEWHVPGLSIAVIDHDQVFAEVNTPS